MTGSDLQENMKFGSCYTELRVERTIFSNMKSRLDQLCCFLFCALYSFHQYILKKSWGVRARNPYPTRGVSGLHEPHGVRLRGADFPQYRQIDHQARKNDIASAPEFPAKRPICTIQYVFRTLRCRCPCRIKPPIKKSGTHCCRCIAYQVHKSVSYTHLTLPTIYSV